MAKPIQNPRVGQALAREFNLVGRVEPLLDEILVPVVLAGDVRSVVAPRTRSGVIHAFQGAGVSPAFAYFRLETPPGTLARVNLVACNPDAAGRLLVHWGSVSAAPANAQLALTYTDGRQRREGATPAVRLFSDTLAAVLTGPNQHWNVPVAAAQTSPVTIPEFTMGQPDAEDFVEFVFTTDATAVRLVVAFEEFPYQTSTAG